MKRLLPSRNSLSSSIPSRPVAWLSTLFSAILLPLAMPNELAPFGIPLIAPICLVPYFITLRHTKTSGEAGLHGLLFGMVSTFCVHYWLMFFGDFSIWTVSSVTIGYGGYHALFAAIIRHGLRFERPWRPFAIGALWAAYEYLKSIGYLGFPWGLMSQPFGSVLLLVQHVDITGIWALSFVAVSVNAVIAEACFEESLHRPPRLLQTARQSIFVLLLLLLMSIYGLQALHTPLPIEREIRATLIQQNTDSWEQTTPEAILSTLQRLSGEAMAQATTPPHLIIWSETSMRLPYPQNRGFYDSTPSDLPFGAFLRRSGTHLLSGIPYIDPDDAELRYNGAILLDPEGAAVDYYAKRHLVPLAEHVPFWENPIMRRFFQERIGLQGGWNIGRWKTIFDLPLHEGGSLPFGVLICFEDSFAELARDSVREGAQLLINLTNNAWSRTNSAQTQHFVAARFRAIETRTPLVRSTNSGLTGVIDAHGRIDNSLPMFRAGWLNVSIPIYGERPPTLYTRFGDWLAWLFLMLVVGLIVASAFMPNSLRNDCGFSTDWRRE